MSETEAHPAASPGSLQGLPVCCCPGSGRAFKFMHDTLCSEETLQPGFPYTPGLDPVPLWSPVNVVLREDPLWVSLSVA